MSEQGFSSVTEFEAQVLAATGSDPEAMQAARARNDVLTKPPGALGRLEDLAIWYAGWRGIACPQMNAPQIIIFAGNHGVTAQGVSAFPSEVTAQMVGNFQDGGAAINQLARIAEAKLDVVALDLDRPTADFTQGPAMNNAELVAALQAGWAAVDPASDCLVVGEMGIGNTTSAAAIATALFSGDASQWVGRGTGVDDEGLARKSAAVSAGLLANPELVKTPLGALQALGGREIAAMTGALARARNLRIPVVLDGFIASAAAAVLWSINPASLDHCVAGHVSAETAHADLLQRLELAPLLSLGLRLGEGSGAAVALQILRAALACHNGMATFEQAAVSEKT